MKYKAFITKAGDRAVVIAGGTETLVIHANHPIETMRELESRMNGLLAEIQAVAATQAEEVELHPISGPDPELQACMAWDYTQEPTKEEWLRERGIPVPGYEDDPDAYWTQGQQGHEIASPQEPNPYPEGSAAHYAFEHCVEPKEPQKPRISMEVGQKPGIGVDESTRMCMEERLVSSETLPKEQLANVYLGNQMGYPRYFAPCASCGEGSWPERFCPYCEGLLPTEPRLVIPG